MATEFKKLQQVFNSRIFRIPDYQRGYAWGKTQVQDFWQDLERIPEGRQHYTGQITMQKVPKEDWQVWVEDKSLITNAGCEPFYIVDGQQRLTTAVILLKCLFDAAGDGQLLTGRPITELVRQYLYHQDGVSRSYVFGYRGDESSYEYFKTGILGQPSNLYEGTKTFYTANMEMARSFFKRQSSSRASGCDTA